MEENKEIEVSFKTDKQLWADLKQFCRKKTKQSGSRVLIKTAATNAIRFYMEHYENGLKLNNTKLGQFLAVGGGFFVKAGEVVNLSSSGVCDEITGIDKNAVLQKGLIEGDLKLADRYNLCLSEYKYLKRKYRYAIYAIWLLGINFILDCIIFLSRYLGV